MKVEKIRKALRRKNLKCAIFTSTENICYVSRYFLSFEVDPSILIIPLDSEPILIIPKREEMIVRNTSPFGNLLIYTNYDLQRKVDVTESLIAVTIKVIRSLNLRNKGVGIEKTSFPFSLYQRIKDEIGEIRYIDISSFLVKVRAIKEARELDLIRQATRICDVGQETIKSLLEEKITEIELFAKARASMEMVAGERIMIAGDLVSGTRSEKNGGGLPVDKKIEPGETIISDFVPRIKGYWADTTATSVVGKNSKEIKRIHSIVLEALNLGKKMIRPGIEARNVDRAIRNFIGKHGYKCPHHIGHGIGTSHFEIPLIVPYSIDKITKGMAFTLEPGIYVTGIGGVRLEDTLIMGEEGLEVVSHHSKTLDTG